MKLERLAITVVAVLGAAGLLLALAGPTPTAALPRYAGATGQGCATCHINPFGGGPRTAIGQAFEAVPTHSSDPAGAWALVSSLSGRAYLPELSRNSSP